MRSEFADDRGASLIEVLVAVVVLGTAGVAAIGSLYTSIRVSDVHRDQATAAAVAGDYSERIAGAPDLGCASAAATYASVASQVDIPAGYSADVDPIEWWTGSGWGACTAGAGLQRVTVEVSSDDGVSERSVVVVRQQ
jgi:prepilin-type N-terminal cleavage/methylation domain-containing protein